MQQNIANACLPMSICALPLTDHASKFLILHTLPSDARRSPDALAWPTNCMSSRTAAKSPQELVDSTHHPLHGGLGSLETPVQLARPRQLFHGERAPLLMVDLSLDQHGKAERQHAW